MCARTTGVVFIFPSYSSSHLLYFYYATRFVSAFISFSVVPFVSCVCVCDHFLWFQVVLVKRENTKRA